MHFSGDLAHETKLQVERKYKRTARRKHTCPAEDQHLDITGSAWSGFLSWLQKIAMRQLDWGADALPAVPRFSFEWNPFH